MTQTKKSAFRAANRPQHGVTFKVPHSSFGSEFGLEEVAAVVEAMQQEWLTNGPQIQAFEEEFADFIGCEYAFGTSNCTTALHLGTQILNVQPGDEVISTPITFIATVEPLLQVGARVVFADVDPRTYNIDPADIERKISPKTTAIYVMHEAGQACDMDPILELARRHGLAVLEDCARAPGGLYKGRKVGSFGDVGCFSFQSVKNMTTLGEGGALTTNREDLANAVPILRAMNVIYGYEMETPPEDGYPLDVIRVNGHIGNNYRMCEPLAAVGRVQLKKLDQLNARRRHLAARLTAGLQGIPGIIPPYEDPNCHHVYHLYQARLDETVLWPGAKQEFLHRLRTEYLIDAGSGNKPIYLFTILREAGYSSGLCPIAEEVYRTFFKLPLYPLLKEEQVDYMVEAIRALLSDMRRSRTHIRAAIA